MCVCVEGKESRRGGGRGVGERNDDLLILLQSPTLPVQIRHVWPVKNGKAKKKPESEKYLKLFDLKIREFLPGNFFFS